MNLRQEQWDASFKRRENFLFTPQEEIVRFFARYIRKRIGLDECTDVLKRDRPIRLLDLGCGIGRHLVFAHQMGLEAYGIDLSAAAVETARKWANQAGIPSSEKRIQVGSVAKLPWDSGYFDVIVSHGVLDSMTFDIAKSAVKECARVLQADGYFYCDLVSPDDSAHGREYAGEEIVSTTHERDTIQSYFNYSKIEKLIEGTFKIASAHLVKRQDLLNAQATARTHLVLQRAV